ncbi:MAG: PD-(D/E)XK nuclease family transposase [Chlamydiales bacterium]
MHRVGSQACPIQICQMRSFTRKIATVPLIRDGFFKALFHDPSDPKKIISFLNAVKGYEGSEKIQDVVFRDPYFPAFTSKEKTIITDVICESLGEKPEIHVVEMQQMRHEGYVKRWEFYASRAYSTELIHQGKYDALKKVHVVALMRYPIEFPNDTYRLTGVKSGAVIHETREVSLFSLSQIPSTISRNDSLLAKWLHLIKYSGSADLNEEVLSEDPALFRAVEHAKKLCQTPPPSIVEERRGGTPWPLLNKKVRELPP